MSVLTPMLVAGAWVLAAFVVSFKAWKARAPGLHGFPRGLLAVVTAVAGLFAASAAYYTPRYGGFIGYVTERAFAGSQTSQLMADIGGVQSALSIYYGDSNGKYPETLDVLWKNQKYLPGPLKHADTFYEPPAGGDVRRAHWYRDTDKIHYFSSVKDSDDSGGWGYVNDPKSPEYGTVFINCTHRNFKNGRPWNLLSRPASEDPPPPPPPLELAIRKARVEHGLPPDVPAAAGAAVPKSGAPNVTLTVSPDRVKAGQPFTVHLAAHSDSGLAMVWWWGERTGDALLDRAHQGAPSGGADYEGNYQAKTMHKGVLTLKANARDLRFGRDRDFAHQASEGSGTAEATITVE